MVLDATKGAAPPWPTTHCQGVHPSPRRGETPAWASRDSQELSWLWLGTNVV